MKKNIFSLIAIAVIGTSTCMAKATPKSVYNPKPRMERKVSSAYNDNGNNHYDEAEWY